MSPDPSPLATSARGRAPHGERAADGTDGTGGRPTAVATACLDESRWSGWWRDLVVERYRFDRFDAFLPLSPTGCTWAQRVALGRVVDQAMADVHGPSITTQLVVEALDAAGFGRVRDLAPDARRTALVRSGWWADPWPADDALRLGVLGSVADALLREVPPTAPIDLRPSSVTGATGATSAPPITATATVLAATRAAVLAYAGHVERLAERSRDAARSLQF
jgi:hypothetical protein